MDEHQRLVNLLISAFQKEGYIILRATGGNFPEPYKIGRHEPDIIATEQSGLIIIGEAKTEDDINGSQSQEQYLDFSNRIMSEGLLKGRRIPLHIIVPKNSSPLLRQSLASLGISNKIGGQIIIWVD